MSGEMPLDPSDLRILRALQRDGRMSNQDLAEASAMSGSACWRRVRALEKAGVIERYSVVLNAEACGLEFHAMVHVGLTRHEPESVQRFVKAVKYREEVLDCYSTTGDADYHLRVCCRNKAAYTTFLEEFLFRIPGVSTVRTNLILDEIKQNEPLPL
ncbi:DNA-binding transcriptional regulator, Lrp family [Salinihabitans flavidus]|uniref:DNA-binding transcriptional regulator, Lrp family n=1 Tax=Salinihabitans flavidus TaxID=569882 RepID=A0A1H8REG6_9RHOB|nr:Lrp/AsnC family transcriptional regulator [Salinihabitans flavidus]SEO64657.1 DNA-binding transcriptional regulator, Lrp family [Salinihabitans flavidus]